MDNNITLQRAIDHFNKSVSSNECVGDTCSEGNLDLQYMIGIAQTTPTSFDYIQFGDVDPVLEWCFYAVRTNISSHTHSISFAIPEEVIFQI